MQACEIPVGCVLVKDDKVIARGRNRTNEGRNATLHAEFDALSHLLPARAPIATPESVRGAYTPSGLLHHGGRESPRPEGVSSVSQDAAGGAAGAGGTYTTPLTGVALYVSVEPCLMCASAMRQVGIDRVYYGCSNDRFGGCGGVRSINKECARSLSLSLCFVPCADQSLWSCSPRLAYSKTYQAIGGYRRAEAIMLLRRFYVTENVNGPPQSLSHAFPCAST